MNVHLIDGTYELFRHFYAVPARQTADGEEVGAVRGVLSSLLGLLRNGATHMGVATDHVIESFRNQMWPGYKRGDGIDPALLGQFHPLEEALRVMGIVVWPMVECEADDALASAAACLTADAEVKRVFICTPDKDLAQCVVGQRVLQMDRRARQVRDADGVAKRFGVRPQSIPDYLALVGDTADGYPGVPGWGAKSTATVLGHYRYLEQIPREVAEWQIPVRGAQRLATNLAEHWQDALLFRELATLRTDAVSVESAAELHWAGPRPEFDALCERLGMPEMAAQVAALARSRSV